MDQLVLLGWFPATPSQPCKYSFFWASSLVFIFPYFLVKYQAIKLNFYYLGVAFCIESVMEVFRSLNLFSGISARAFCDRLYYINRLSFSSLDPFPMIFLRSIPFSR